MLGSRGGGGLPPAWPHISGAILERSGLVRFIIRKLIHASYKRTKLMHNITSMAIHT
jgi:hypothetical protein